MRCKCCNNKIDLKNCSERDGLIFYGICQNCKIVNRLSIDLDINEIVSSIAEDEELMKVKMLFDKRNENLKKKLYETEKDRECTQSVMYPYESILEINESGVIY